MTPKDIVAREEDARIREVVHTPTFLVVAGALPGLFAATSLDTGLAIGLVTAAAIFAMALLMPLVRLLSTGFVRVACALLVSATVVTLVGFACQIADPVSFEALGIYVPLASVNAVAMTFVVEDGFACAPARRSSLATGVFAAMTVLLTLAFVGFINGMLSTGQVFGLTMNELAASPLAIFGKPAGSLLVLALVAVFVQACERASASSTTEGGER